jgi:hypothetical protein
MYFLELHSANQVSILCRLPVLRTMQDAWSTLPAPHQASVTASILASAARDPSRACRSAAQATLQALPLAASHLAPALAPLASLHDALAIAANAPAAGSAKRVCWSASAGDAEMHDDVDASAPDAAAGAEDVLASALPVLEMLQWKRNVQGAPELLEPLQRCLRSCLALSEASAEPAGTDAPCDAHRASPTAATYACQLVLAALRRLLAEQGEAVAGAIDIELVLRAVERAGAANAEAAALELLAAAAAAAPEVTLDSVLAVLHVASASDQAVRIATCRAAV